jgi:hypothetical protein
MSQEDCYNRIRYSLSDASGVMRFTSFEIIDAPQCKNTNKLLREHLMSRPVADVDLDYLRGMTCELNGECIRTVIRIVEDYQRLLV